MKTREELIDMRNKLQDLMPRLQELYEFYKPSSKFFGLINKGDIFMASRMVENKMKVRGQIKLISWVLGDKKFYDFENDEYGILLECVDDWTEDIKDKVSTLSDANVALPENTNHDKSDEVD